MIMVTSNSPGYLSEQEDPATFDDITSARQCLADEIQRDWDYDYEGCLTWSQRAAVDQRYIKAHTLVNTLSPDDYVHVAGYSASHLGRNYHLTTVHLMNDEKGKGHDR